MCYILGNSHLHWRNFSVVCIILALYIVCLVHWGMLSTSGGRGGGGERGRGERGRGGEGEGGEGEGGEGEGGEGEGGEGEGGEGEGEGVSVHQGDAMNTWGIS